MARTLQHIRDEALQLSVEDRLELASELIDSVEGPADPEWERAYRAELDARVAAADAREVRGRPWDDVRAELLHRYGGR